MPRKIITLSDSARVSLRAVNLEPSTNWAEESVGVLHTYQQMYPGMAWMAVDLLVQQEVSGIDGDYSLSALYISPSLYFRALDGSPVQSGAMSVVGVPVGCVKFVLDKSGRPHRRVSHACVPYSVVQS